jgi:hypothetical protein
MTNIILSQSALSCPPEAKKVSFTSPSYEIFVDTNQKIVSKDGKSLPFVESFGGSGDEYGLLFAAIFSDAKIYECQVKRLMAHASELAEVYDKKRTVLTCSTDTLNIPMADYKRAVSNAAANFGANINSINLLAEVKTTSENLENGNPSSCKVF